MTKLRAIVIFLLQSPTARFPRHSVVQSFVSDVVL